MRTEKGRFWTRYDKVARNASAKDVNNKIGSLYAVLFNAQAGPHHEDIAKAFNSLKNAGVSNSNIFYMENKGNLDKNIYPATAESLDSVISTIKQIATSNDRLLVFTTGYGFLDKGLSTLETHNGKLNEQEYQEILKDLPFNFVVSYSAQNDSRGFAERMSEGKYIGISSVKKGEEAIGTQKHPIKRMVAADEKIEYKFTQAVNFTHFLIPELLNPGVTIEQAFDRAVYENTSFLRVALGIGQHDTLGPMHPVHYGKETPQLIWQNADPSKLYLGLPNYLKTRQAMQNDNHPGI
ncbi:MAG: hypothetical protein ACP5N2_01915 [Candidatus Nanoarchaeia archaeon]